MLLRFDKIGGNIMLDPQRNYLIPTKTLNGLRATHVGLKNGFIAFFWSPDDVAMYKSKTGKWLFIEIPDGAKNIAFPEAEKTNAGWRYGVRSTNGYKRIDG